MKKKNQPSESGFVTSGESVANDMPADEKPKKIRKKKADAETADDQPEGASDSVEG